RGVLDRSDLPQAALDYIDFLEQELEASADLISSGPRREETVVSGGGTLQGWLGERLGAVRSAVGG
ncbi:MAG: adenylosuccinate synthetase, partial [Acidobacteria bacterium]|nr:adenylosuccinate synthetase [Acidobacteriota bacterium]